MANNKPAPRHKHVNYRDAIQGAQPFESSDLLDKESLRERFKNYSSQDQHKFIAYLFAFKTAPTIAQLLDIKVDHVYYACRVNRDITQKSRMNRNFMISEIAERKAFDIINGINPSKLEDKEKAKSAKYLVDTAGSAQTSISRGQRSDNEETVGELIFRVKKRAKLPEQQEKNITDAEYEEE